MVIDKGLGVDETVNLLSVASPYVDFIKLAFGTSLLYNEQTLNAKIEAIRSFHVDVYPGGTLLELALAQGKAEAFIDRSVELGFSALEVSEGTLPVSDFARHRLIKYGKEAGLRVVSEVGKKEKGTQLLAEDVLRRVDQDLEYGAEFVIVEGRESGLGVGAYDDQGRAKGDLVEAVLNAIDDPSKLMWEAPLQSQQREWILQLGANVNLGNVQPTDALALEATRQGLRGDTMKRFFEQFLQES